MSIELVPYEDSWPPDDPDANFKREVAEYTRQDPMVTLRPLAEGTGIPMGALVRYILVKWSAEGSETLLALGPPTVRRMWEAVEQAEDAATDEARLEAYDTLRQFVSWLRAGLGED